MCVYLRPIYQLQRKLNDPESEKKSGTLPKSNHFLPNPSIKFHQNPFLTFGVDAVIKVTNRHNLPLTSTVFSQHMIQLDQMKGITVYKSD